MDMTVASNIDELNHWERLAAVIDVWFWMSGRVSGPHTNPRENPQTLKITSNSNQIE